MSSRLLSAVERGLVGPLEIFGLTATGGGGERGETVECSNGSTLITVAADWLEGELAVTLQRFGEAPQAIEDLLDLSQVKGLHLTRLGKGASVDVVAAQLQRVATALREQRGDLLAFED